MAAVCRAARPCSRCSSRRAASEVVALGGAGAAAVDGGWCRLDAPRGWPWAHACVLLKVACADAKAGSGTGCDGSSAAQAGSLRFGGAGGGAGGRWLTAGGGAAAEASASRPLVLAQPSSLRRRCSCASCAASLSAREFCGVCCARVPTVQGQASQGGMSSARQVGAQLVHARVCRCGPCATHQL
jgi:hypothetical protein